MLNFRQAPETEFEHYGHEFHRAARLLMRRFSSKPGFSDLEALPIVFLYRHVLELYLKAIVQYGDLLLGLAGKPLAPDDLARIFSSHQLSLILPHLRAIFRFMGWGWNFGRAGLRTFDDIKAVIREICAVDPHSYAFRYPTNTQGKAALPDSFEFDLRSLVKVVDALVDGLDSAARGLSQACDDAGERYASTS